MICTYYVDRDKLERPDRQEMENRDGDINMELQKKCTEYIKRRIYIVPDVRRIDIDANVRRRCVCHAISNFQKENFSTDRTQ